MDFYIGQIFTGSYPPEAAMWCNENGAVMKKINDSEYEITAPPGPSLEDSLAAIEAKYAGKQAELDSALVNALWVDGPQESSIRSSLMAKRQKLIDDRDAEMAALFA